MRESSCRAGIGLTARYLDPRSHLKPGDLRRRLIEYAEDPYRALTAMKNTESVPESVLEREVAARLAALGYRVVPHWKIGHYVIDLVIENNGKRLAVECEGDRFRPLERLPDDMARLAVLERLGWTFVRIRGSQFLRDPDRAMESILGRLKAAGIEPVARGESGETPVTQDMQLRDRIVKRAQAIRQEWQGEEWADDRLAQRDNQRKHETDDFKATPILTASGSVKRWCVRPAFGDLAESVFRRCRTVGYRRSG